jgi:hypothetical protein
MIAAIIGWNGTTKINSGSEAEQRALVPDLSHHLSYAIH